MGTIFSPMPSELKGNIVCLDAPDESVIGFIDVAEVELKRLFIDNNLEGIYNDEEYDYCNLYTYEELTRGISPVLPDMTSSIKDIDMSYCQRTPMPKMNFGRIGNAWTVPPPAPKRNPTSGRTTINNCVRLFRIPIYFGTQRHRFH